MNQGGLSFNRSHKDLLQVGIMVEVFEAGDGIPVIDEGDGIHVGK